MEFLASLHSCKVDSEGEATIVLKSPLSELSKVIQLISATQQLLKIKVEIVE